MYKRRGNILLSKALFFLAVLSVAVLAFMCTYCYSAQTSGDLKKGTQNSPVKFTFGDAGKWKYDKWRGPKHWQITCPWFIWVVKAADRKEYHQMSDYVRAHGTKCIGYYYTSTLALPDSATKTATNFQEAGLPRSLCDNSWFIPDGKGGFANYGNQPEWYFLDIANVDVQHAVLERATSNAKNLNCDALCLDNFRYKKYVPYPYDRERWPEGALSFLKTARLYTKRKDLKLVINLGDDPRDWMALTPFVDGFSYEYGCRPSMFESPALLETDLSAYEYVLSQRKTVFLWTGRVGHGTSEQYDPDGRKLALVALLVMPPEQREWGGVYISVPSPGGGEVWPTGGWLFWPEQLGKPIGSRQWKANTVVREFERGVISITVGRSPEFSIKLNY